jgi:hypothetical protein
MIRYNAPLMIYRVYVANDYGSLDFPVTAAVGLDRALVEVMTARGYKKTSARYGAPMYSCDSPDGELLFRITPGSSSFNVAAERTLEEAVTRIDEAYAEIAEMIETPTEP